MMFVNFADHQIYVSIDISINETLLQLLLVITKKSTKSIHSMRFSIVLKYVQLAELRS